jgi:hypothetical protein
MSRISWHLESFAWWVVLTGGLVIWCAVMTIGFFIGLFRSIGR